MSDHFLIADSRCFEQRLTPIELAVYIRICMRGHKSVCFESIKKIATACGTSERSVNNSLLKLSSLKMIEITSGKKTGKSNCIHLVAYENWVKLENEVDHTDLSSGPNLRTTCVGGTHVVRRGYAGDAEGVRTTCGHNSTLEQNPISGPFIADAVQSTALKEKKKYTRKNCAKLWVDKNDEEKFLSLLEMAKDSHTGGVQQNRRIKPYPFDDFPDLLEPLVKKYGTETMKDLFDYGKAMRRGLNVRWLEGEIEEMLEEKKGGNYQHAC